MTEDESCLPPGLAGSIRLVSVTRIYSFNILPVLAIIVRCI